MEGFQIMTPTGNFATVTVGNSEFIKDSSNSPLISERQNSDLMKKIKREPVTMLEHHLQSNSELNEPCHSLRPSDNLRIKTEPCVEATYSNKSPQLPQLETNYKLRDLYVKLVRLDWASSNSRYSINNIPTQKAKVSSPAKTVNSVTQSNADTMRKHSTESTHPMKAPPPTRTHAHSRKRPGPQKPEAGTSKPQGTSCLAAKLVHAYFAKSSALQSILKDVLVMRKECNSISERSIEQEITAIKQEYHLQDMDSMDIEFMYSDTDSADSFMTSAGSKSPIPCSSRSTPLNKGYEEQISDLKGNDSSMITVALSNGLEFQLDPTLPECPICTKMFQSFNSLQQHLKFCFINSSTSAAFSGTPSTPNIKTEPVEQNEMVGHFIVKQELSIESPIKIQQVFPSESLPSDLVPPPVIPKAPKIIQKEPKLLNTLKNIDSTGQRVIAETSSASTSVAATEKPDDFFNVLKIPYHCCLCDYSALSQKELLIHCSTALMGLSQEGQTVNCRACTWKQRSEPFLLAHTQMFARRRVRALICRYCKGLMFNHDMFMSHEVKQECVNAACQDAPVTLPAGDSDDDCLIIDE